MNKKIVALFSIIILLTIGTMILFLDKIKYEKLPLIFMWIFIVEIISFIGSIIYNRGFHK